MLKSERLLKYSFYAFFVAIVDKVRRKNANNWWSFNDIVSTELYSRTFTNNFKEHHTTIESKLLPSTKGVARILTPGTSDNNGRP